MAAESTELAAGCQRRSRVSLPRAMTGPDRIESLHIHVVPEWIIFKVGVIASSQPDHLVVRESDAEPSNAAQADAACLQTSLTPVSPSLLGELWRGSGAEACQLTIEEFSQTLAAAGARSNFGQPRGTHPDEAQRAVFLRGLHLNDLALAAAFALGREAAWQRFLDLYRAPLTQTAVAMARSATVGHDLADSLYGELYGVRAGPGVTAVEHSSPLASYSGRGSLLGWLRATLAQRHVHHHRRTRRESPLDTLDLPAPAPAHVPLPADRLQLKHAVVRTLQGLAPEHRFLLAAYFLDGRTLREIAILLHVHEATTSRRLKSLSADLRKNVLDRLQRGGLSIKAAEEAVGIDPRDLEINLQWLLQSSQAPPFQNRASLETAAQPAESGQS